MLAEVTGLTGQVTTVDIDEDVTDRAARFLEHAGYSRVRVALADAEGGVDGGPFDRSLVTFGAWDIPPTWVRQMADGGVLTVPLRMAGLTRVVTFVKDGELLVSTDHEMFGFVPFPVKTVCSWFRENRRLHDYTRPKTAVPARPVRLARWRRRVGCRGSGARAVR